MHSDSTHRCSQTPYMHVTLRDAALESNMHDRIVNTCIQTAHMFIVTYMHVTLRDAALE